MIRFRICTWKRVNLVLSLSILEVGRRVMREVVLLSSKSQRNGKGRERFKKTGVGNKDSF